MPTTYNKVTAGNQTLIDLSQDTVTQASHIMAGYVGHLANGQQITGTGSGGGLNIVEVTGATPSITGEANKRYLCGTVTSLTITIPESGMMDVVFTSGSTATTLTATGVTFPAWFTVEKNYKYEISILDGMAVVAAWPTT